jgi:vacuolar-type H+-ATPase subunit I/STV1
LANQTAKLRLAIKLSQEDSQAISFLKQELEKTFKVLELSKEREERAKQKIEALNAKIKLLQSNLEQFQNFSVKKSNALG